MGVCNLAAVEVAATCCLSPEHDLMRVSSRGFVGRMVALGERNSVRVPDAYKKDGDELRTAQCVIRAAQIWYKMGRCWSCRAWQSHASLVDDEWFTGLPGPICPRKESGCR